MKILHVIPSISPLRGGPSKAVIEMVNELAQQGVDVEIATTNDHGPGELDVPLGQLIEYKGVAVHFFKRFSPAITQLREFAYSDTFKQWLKEHIGDYDLIHVHAIFSYTSSYTMRLARKRGIPYIVRPIGQLETWALLQSRWRKRIFLACFERANLLGACGIHFTADSEHEQALSEISELKQANTSFVLPLGIRNTVSPPQARAKLVEQYALNQECTIILFLSRIHPKKGLELLLSALTEHDAKDWHLLIAGDGDPNYLDAIKRMIDDLKLEHRCQMIGFASGAHKQNLLHGADLYVLTSHSENFGISVLEALAAGTTALVSRGVALSTFIEAKNIGYVCDVTVPSISQSLEVALNDNQHRGKQAAKCIKQHYSWQPIVSQLIEQYKNCINNSSLD